MFNPTVAFVSASIAAAAAFRGARAAARARTPQAAGWTGSIADEAVSRTGSDGY